MWLCKWREGHIVSEFDITSNCSLDSFGSVLSTKRSWFGVSSSIQSEVVVSVALSLIFEARALNSPRTLTALSRSSCCLSLRYGDYPKLPDRSQQERDPWYDWDHPDLRLNWGEPVRKPLPILLPLSFLMCSWNSLFSSNAAFLLSFSAQGSRVQWDLKLYMWQTGWNLQEYPRSVYCDHWACPAWASICKAGPVCLRSGSENIAPKECSASLKPWSAF